jgi:acyl-CoA synthetase (NDP forming)
VTDAVLNEFGVVRARNTEELLDIAYTATKRIYPVGNTLGVMTVSGGAGVLISDVAESGATNAPPIEVAHTAPCERRRTGAHTSLSGTCLVVPPCTTARISDPVSGVIAGGRSLIRIGLLMA